MNQDHNHSSREVPPTIPDDDTIRASDKHDPNNRRIMSHWKFGQRLDEGSRIELFTSKSMYILKKTLGEGGFGITYLAEDEEGREVVIKTLNEKMQNCSDARKYLDKEIFAIGQAKCHHPHIVRIIKIDHHQELPFIVMEYIDGENLDELVRRRGIIPEKEAITYIQQIGGALTIVHDRDLLHRDVKPHNIIIRADGRGAVLIDFGIARNFIPQEQGPLTSFRSVGYAPIEQYNPKGNQGYHSDVHGLAATLYFMLTGKTPIDAEKRVMTREDQLDPPNKWNPNISNKVNQAILKGMERYHEERPQTVQEWLDLLLAANSKRQKKEDSVSPFPLLNQELFFEAAVTGFAYGVLTSPLTHYFPKPGGTWIVAGCWLLILSGLIFSLFYGTLNFIFRRNIKFLMFAIVTVTLILLLYLRLQEPLMTVVMSVGSTALGFLLMVVFMYLSPIRYQR
jgi:serine/threonine protein kinase